MFTDIVDSTPLWEASADVMMEQLAVHDRVLSTAMLGHGGEIFSTMGDGLAAAFADANAAVRAMVDAQRALAATDWPEGFTIRVRMGAHTGPAQNRDDDFFGPTVNLAARVMGAGHGEQILLTETTARLVDPPAGCSIETLGAHRLKGVARPTELAMVQRPEGPTGFPPLRVLDPGRFTIPVPANPLVGREDDLRAIHEGIRTRRCTTIWATGGAGKTRLALEAAIRACDVFPAGVHVIELADTDFLDDLVTRVSEHALGTETTAGPDDHLRRLTTELTEPVLIVIDNAEHVIDACAKAIESLLRATTKLTFLVTSREPLRIDGEHAHPLEPLGTAAGGRSEAAQLFIERALAASPKADIDIEAVDQIVERLDGLPLAVELAAAHVGMLGTRELLTHLDKVLRHAPGRRGGSRHRTVEAAIDWSVERCTPLQRELLARLSVFSGTFDLDAVNAICADDSLDTFEIFATMATLVDASLVSSFDGATSRRYRLLQLIRSYASNLSTTADDLAVRHAEHYLDIAREESRKLHREARPEAGAALSEEHENFITVLERGTEDPDHLKTARRLCVRLQSYWEDTGRLRVGADWMARLNEPQDVGDRSWGGMVLIGATYDAMCGLTPLGRQPVDAIRSFADMGMPGMHAMHMPLAFIDLSRGEIPEAIERFEKAAAGFGDADVMNHWQALMTAGALADYQSDPVLASGFYGRADSLDQQALATWTTPYRTVFVTGSELGQRLEDSDEASVKTLVDAFDELVRTEMATRITIAGHRAMWALERAGRVDLLADRLIEVMGYPRRTGYLWFSLALADLAAHITLRCGDGDLALRLEGAVDSRMTVAEYGFPRSFSTRREHPARRAVPEDLAAKRRAEGDDLTVAQIDELAAAAVGTWS